MKHTGLVVIIIYTVVVTITTQYGEVAALTKPVDHKIMKRQSIAEPMSPCTSSNEGEAVYNANIAWLCISGNWVAYRLSPSSCNEIKQSGSTSNGVYWVQGMQVYCDLAELDGGGWTLVWQHSYTENLPLSQDMTFFSDHYRPCTTRASGWCNIPNKARYSATEQMIVAYHRGTVVYAYKGLLNRNIDYNWSGAILLDFVKIVDRCKQGVGTQPAPENTGAIGLTFDKWTPYNYKANCDSYRGTFASAGDCRWENCRLPSSISSRDAHVQMTMAIFVR